MSAAPHRLLLFFSVYPLSTYCKQQWWDCGWEGLPVATDPITKPVFPMLRSTGCSKWCRKSTGRPCMFFAHSCVYLRTHTGWCQCVYSKWLCVSRLMGCWCPSLVEANIREQTTYYYWSTPGQNNNPCVEILLSHSGWWTLLPSFDRV